MDYQQFLAYRNRLSQVELALDQLNPYDLKALLALTTTPSETLVFDESIYLQHGLSIRALLKALFDQFTQQNHPLYLPEDIYPVYFQLAGETADIKCYQSTEQRLFDLPTQANAVFLISNPLIPEGYYLTATQLKSLDLWLLASTRRYLIIDTVYDFKGEAMATLFVSSRVIFVGSLSKLGLQPQTQAWAIAKTPFLSAEKKQQFLFPAHYGLCLQEHFEQAWQELLKQEVLPVAWNPPEVGYLTVVECAYETLYQSSKIATIPSRVFGIKNKNISVISCLSLVLNK
ncbi:MAG: hypothetical protein KAG28_08930 [Cocleimonas sp.]|nr:hypothetical protein [Cocleimonas sp.]